MRIMQNFTKNNLIRDNSDLASRFEVWITKQWTKFGVWHLFLKPLSWFYGGVIAIRVWLFKVGVLRKHVLRVPVVVVGNITVGGTGKTPLVIYIVEHFKRLGLKPGVISRGYAGSAKGVVAVASNSDPGVVGDEPLLIAKRTSVPVYVGADRVAVGKRLLEQHNDCDVIISDDGMQHYQLHRDAEIAVIDGAKVFGNRALIPAGPLREPLTRLNSADIMVVNGLWQGMFRLEDVSKTREFNMKLISERFYNLVSPNQTTDGSLFVGKSIAAITGIGNPKRFFNQIEAFGFDFNKVERPDHHAFAAHDFDGLDADIIVMTEKDAVKCAAFAKTNFWVLPVSADIDVEFIQLILEKLDA